MKITIPFVRGLLILLFLMSTAHSPVNALTTVQNQETIEIGKSIIGSPASGQTSTGSEDKIVPVIVKFKNPLSSNQRTTGFVATRYDQLDISNIPSSLSQAHRLYNSRSISHAFPHRPHPLFNGIYLLTFQKGTAEQISATLSAHSDVVYAHPLRHIQFLSYNDPLFSNQWHMYQPGTRIDASGLEILDLSAYGIKPKSTPVVAIIDRSIYLHHEDIQNNLWKNTKEKLDGTDTDGNGYIDDVWGCVFEFNGMTENPVPQCGTYMGYISDSHGTAVAGIVAADSNNGIGIRGVCESCKVMRAGIYPTDLSAAAALLYAVDNGASVVNMSFSLSISSPLLKDMISYAASKNVVLVAAAGNSTGSGYGLTYPAKDTNVIAVSGHNKQGTRSYHASMHPEVEVSAASEAIYTTVFPPTYDGFKYAGYFEGTSFASPQVAGVAGLLRSYAPGLSREEVRAVIKNSTDPHIYAKPEHVGNLGTGRLNAFRALYKALNLEKVHSGSTVTSVQCYNGETRLEIRSSRSPATVNGKEAQHIANSVYSAWVKNGSKITIKSDNTLITMTMPTQCTVSKPRQDESF